MRRKQSPIPERLGETSFLPAAEADRALLLDAFLVEKALAELAYELDHRPEWVTIPLRGIMTLLGERM